MDSKMGKNFVPPSKDPRRAISDADLDARLSKGLDLQTPASGTPVDSPAKPKPEPTSQKMFSLSQTQDIAIENLRRKSATQKIPSRSDILRAGLVLLLDCPPRRLDEIISQVQAAATDEDLRKQLYQRDA